MTLTQDKQPYGPDPVAKCRCGRLFTPMEWAELPTAGMGRHCPCGLAAMKIAIISYDDVKAAYEEALKEE